MGNAPSSATEEQRKELLASADERCVEAAKRIAEADVFLLLTGAGFSADSGLAVYADVAKVPAYKDRGLKYHDICQPQWLDSEPALFWGFWGQCFNDYRNTAPHEGYAMLSRWAEKRFRRSDIAEEIRAEFQSETGKRQDEEDEPPVRPYEVNGTPGAFFAFTSNVDAHHYDHFHAHEIRECHGNTELYQCAKQCDRHYIWRAPRDFRFDVDKSTMMAPDGPAADASTADGELMQAAYGEGATVPAIGRVRGGGRPDALRFMQGGHDRSEFYAFANNHPVCPKCGGPARPAILMFGDGRWTDLEDQSDRFDAWTDALETVCKEHSVGEGSQLKVALMEIGAGGNVTTVRCQSEALLKTLLKSCGADATLIRVNFDMPFGDDDDFADGGQHSHRVISILGRGLEALRKIDAAMPTEMQ